MGKINKKHVGSDFEGFLADDGTLAEATIIAVKRVLAWELAEAMRQQNITKAEMARRMETSRPALDRLLDAENDSVTLRTLDRAAKAIGKRLQLDLV
jgi:transcriptional regulator with XRE-family HTH domain